MALETGQVIDIGGSSLPSALVAMIYEQLFNQSPTERLLSHLFMYDETGLALWAQATRLPNYYQSRDEIELLQLHGAEIADHIADGCCLMDLGSG